MSWGKWHEMPRMGLHTRQSSYPGNVSSSRNSSLSRLLGQGEGWWRRMAGHRLGRQTAGHGQWRPREWGGKCSLLRYLWSTPTHKVATMAGKSPSLRITSRFWPCGDAERVESKDKQADPHCKLTDACPHRRPPSTIPTSCSTIRHPLLHGIPGHLFRVTHPLHPREALHWNLPVTANTGECLR